MNIINDDYVMLFGGNDGARQNDTWLFDISARNWTEIFPTTSPGARFSHFATNYLTRDLLMFGGTDGSNLGDNWIFSLIQDPQILDFELNKVISNTARFRARINDGNDEANYYIQYGTSSGKYDFRTDEETIDNNGDNSIVAINITGLSELTSYFAQLVIYNSLSTVVSEEIRFSTISSSSVDDRDEDEISDEVEDSAPNDGDGNGDGQADSEQTYVTSLDTDQGYVTVEIVSTCPNLESVLESKVETNSNYFFPYGTIEFRVPCNEAEVKIYFHGASDLSGYNYRKQQSDGSWFNFENAEFGSDIIDGKEVGTVTLNLIDGGAGDFDGMNNGIIYDPGGPALLLGTTIPIWEWWHLVLATVILMLVLIIKQKLN